MKENCLHLFFSKINLVIILFITIVNIGHGQTITIGNQVWMTKNLDISTFRNGDSIKYAKTKEDWMKANENKQPAWTYYNNDPSNGTIYGKLYNWYAVIDSRGLAPKGWHIPKNTEWSTLIGLLGEKDAGIKMKSTIGWVNKGNGTNKSGFNGLPGGKCSGDFSFYAINEGGNWWSSTEWGENYAIYRNLNYGYEFVGRNDEYKGYGLSVRCLKN